MEKVILFDGVCNFCNSSVMFIIKRDRKAIFKFASLQSDIGMKLLKQYNLPIEMDSFVLIDNEKSYSQSTAALRICKDLNGFWSLFYTLLVIPRPIRDMVYHLIAKNRYKLFGKKDSCSLPSPKLEVDFYESAIWHF